MEFVASRSGSMSWDDVMNAATRDDANKRDYRVPLHGILFDEGLIKVDPTKILQKGTYDFDNTLIAEGFYPTDHCVTQVANALEMPVKYSKWLRQQGRPGLALFDRNANFVAARQENNPMFLRTVGNNGRALLSQDYTAIGNTQVLDIVAGLSKDQYAADIKRMYLGAEGFWLQVVCPELVYDDPTAQGQKLFGGFNIGNSEIGSRKVSIEFFIYRLACLNGLIVRVKKLAELAWRHIHYTVRELRDRIVRALAESLELGNEVAQRFIDSHSEPLPNLQKVIARLAEQNTWTQKFQDAVIEQTAGEPGTKFGLINSVTAAAKSLNPDARIEMERFAGTLIDLDVAA